MIFIYESMKKEPFYTCCIIYQFFPNLFIHLFVFAHGGLVLINFQMNRCYCKNDYKIKIATLAGGDEADV